MTGRTLGSILIVVLAGCGLHHGSTGGMDYAVDPQAPLANNPMYVPLSDREFLWNQLVDTVDNYFRIVREERVRMIGGVLTEGRVETLPLPGSTMFEPWRSDSTEGFERRYATFQSIRRRAVARVMPQTDGGFLVELMVFKELEDVSQPEYAATDAASLRHDGTIVRPEATEQAVPTTLGWIPMGRDLQLEQRILVELRGRLGVTLNQ